MRVASLNIHGGYGPRLPGIRALLQGLDLDVVALQECPPAALPYLGGEGWHYAWAKAYYLGNGLLSRRPLRDVAEVSLGAPPRETRSAVLATIGDLRVCCVHLDHLSEDERLDQWDELRDLAREALVAGDLNAVRREDYAAEEWAAIARMRQRASIEPPRPDLLAALQADGFADAGAGAPLQATCRFQTRIDYLLAGPRCGWRFVPGSYRVVPAIPAVSDHNLVLADVEPAIPAAEVDDGADEIQGVPVS